MNVTECPHCQTQVDVTGYDPGTVLSCGNCGGEFEVPGPAAARPVGARGRGGSRSGPPGRRSARGGSRSSRGRGRDRPTDVPDLLVPSILVTIFCCLIGGIISIVYSSQANSYKNAGQYGAAARAANSAKTWITVSIVTGVVFALLWALLLLTGSARF